MSNLEDLKSKLNRLPTLLAIQQEKARRNFWEYCLHYDPEFFQKRPFFKPVANILQWVYEEYQAGRPRKVGISMPPRAGKSYITSLFASWWLGKLPHLSIMRNACTARLYEKFSYDVRNIVLSPKWQGVFPELYLSDNKSNLNGWNLTTAKQVSYFGAGVGGTIIGFGANLAISDDLYRGLEDALSENYNEKVLVWKESAHDSRKERNCPEVFIGTRWHKKDIIGQAKEADKLDEYVIIPALDDDMQTFCDDVKTTKEYLEIKNSIDPTIWDAEYMQCPNERAGFLFPKSELGFFDPEQLKSASEHTVITVDPADKGGDFYGAPVGEVHGNYIFITDVLFNKRDTDENIPDTVQLAIDNKAHYVQVESNGGWAIVGKNIRTDIQDKLPNCIVRMVKATQNKETRILSNSAYIRNTFRFRSDWETCSPQYRDFMINLFSYMREGKNKHDDAPDVLTAMAEYCQKHLSHL